MSPEAERVLQDSEVWGYAALNEEGYLCDDRMWPATWRDRSRRSGWLCVFDTAALASAYGTPVVVFCGHEFADDSYHPHLNPEYPR